MRPHAPQHSNSPNQSAGLYVHIPFCRSKCRYCDFYSIADLSRLADYLAALQKEMQFAAQYHARADTLYVGGGTPSLLQPSQMGDIVDWAADHLNLTFGAEITLEVNPATVTARDLADFAAAGVNRLNIGVQSFNDLHLGFLGRRHTAKQALAAVQAGQDAGFNNIGLDLIFGLPHQSTADWQSDLLQAIRLSPKHLSCYILTYEPGTRLHFDLRAGCFSALPDRRIADLFRLTHGLLNAAGYEHYEISNYAKANGWRSKHNEKYWNFAPYFGFGPSAHSYFPPVRWWNHGTLESYLGAVQKGHQPKHGEERLSDEQQMMEMLFLGLRQSGGIEFEQFQKRFFADFRRYFHSALERFLSKKWVDMNDRRCCLTAEGMLFVDRIVDELVDMIN
ncbi:MAG: radical SAM family heme chaperone HemW [Desulfatitalea sp.]|nr:radical SAM family heme chaperone HemW [Desulfatitalea sp.]NNJ98988.1 radical SAM family heme chaperone HemW [Desulfatitalea sp.]